MTEPLVAAATLALFIASSYGWGRLALHATSAGNPGSWAFTSALGVAVWVALGGALNLLHLARAEALYAVFASGLLLWAGFSLRGFRNLLGTVAGLAWSKRPDLRSVLRSIAEFLPTATFSVPVVLTILWLLPTQAFNFHDDFHKYFVHPLRMLQSGSLDGGPFDQIGTQTLGAQAFLQGFLIARFPLEYINGLDLVLCFLLGGMLIEHLGRRLRLPWIHRLVAVAAFVAISPQHVNISASYSGSSMILGMIYASLLLSEELRRPTGRLIPGAAVALGLFAASLVALKATLAPFTVSYLALVSLALAWAATSARRTIAAIVAVLAVAGLALAAWLAVSGSDYLTLTSRVTARAAESAGGDGLLGGLLSAAAAFLSPRQSFYGGHYLHYGFIIALLGVLGITAACLAVRERPARDASCWGVSGAAGLAAALSSFALCSVAPVDQGLRYASPVLVAALAAVGSMFLAASRRGVPHGSAAHRVVLAPGVAVLVCLSVVIGMFADSSLSRAALARDKGTALSFPVTESYLRYMNIALSEDRHETIEHIQRQTEEGATVLAWLSTPFHLDFERNVVLTLEAPHRLWTAADRGVWAGQPRGMSSYLRRLGVRYVIWEYRGYGMRSDGSLRARMRSRHYVDSAGKALALMRLLDALRDLGHIVHDDGSIIVLDLARQSKAGTE